MCLFTCTQRRSRRRVRVPPRVFASARNPPACLPACLPARPPACLHWMSPCHMSTWCNTSACLSTWYSMSTWCSTSTCQCLHVCQLVYMSSDWPVFVPVAFVGSVMLEAVCCRESFRFLRNSLRLPPHPQNRYLELRAFGSRSFLCSWGGSFQQRRSRIHLTQDPSLCRFSVIMWIVNAWEAHNVSTPLRLLLTLLVELVPVQRLSLLAAFALGCSGYQDCRLLRRVRGVTIWRHMSHTIIDYSGWYLGSHAPGLHRTHVNFARQEKTHEPQNPRSPSPGSVHTGRQQKLCVYAYIYIYIYIHI